MTNDERDKFANKFGMTNLLSPETKSSYKKFAQEVHKIDNASLFKLNSGIADELSSEEKDIVAWEIKIRELDNLKKHNIDPSEHFSVENYHVGAEYDTEDPRLEELKFTERKRTEEMSDDLLERSKAIIENTPVVIKSSDLRTVGRGVNMLCNKYTVVDDDGNRITINNRAMQEHYRKMYIKRMSEITGIDYTQYDLDSDTNDIPFDNTDTLESPTRPPINDETNLNLNLDDYEDD